VTDQVEIPRPNPELGLDRETLYTGGGLAPIGNIWYYDATVENARIEKKRERLDRRIVTECRERRGSQKRAR
jgi:hypothetical protein